MLTIKADDFTREEVEEKLKKYDYLGQLECGEESGYLHWQVLIENKTAIKFETLKNKFRTAHCEVAKNPAACRKYVSKEETRVPGEELLRGGKFVNWEPETKEVLGDAVSDLRHSILFEDKSADELILSDGRYRPYVAYAKELERIRDASKFGRSPRESVNVRYVYGAPGVGKTWGVYEEFGYPDVYSPGTYIHPWDEYQSQRVLLLDEFDGQIEFELLLKVLDIYPLTLPCRYQNKYAAWDTVIMVSNNPLECLPYRDRVSASKWAALLRRIDVYEEMVSRGVCESRLDRVQKTSA
ncbi:hypothetical protein O6R08_10315 [Cutibacterium equinum]|uniref:ATP-dependent helicase Rep n=1 Tax=Cutibacterium equinum TaxID=3016342 RepID=A0ABY7QXQ7_9ACTN|nr:hypothetical protein [Cutibacterium equinum]WCC79838.1 hypothetical protein O6R08_10315 [Cutibacterium equinum]